MQVFNSTLLKSCQSTELLSIHFSHSTVVQSLSTHVGFHSVRFKPLIRWKSLERLVLRRQHTCPHSPRQKWFTVGVNELYSSVKTATAQITMHRMRNVYNVFWYRIPQFGRGLYIRTSQKWSNRHVKRYTPTGNGCAMNFCFFSQHMARAQGPAAVKCNLEERRNVSVKLFFLKELSWVYLAIINIQLEKKHQLVQFNCWGASTR